MILYTKKKQWFTVVVHGILLVLEFREEKRTFTKVERGNVDFFLSSIFIKAAKLRITSKSSTRATNLWNTHICSANFYIISNSHRLKCSRILHHGSHVLILWRLARARSSGAQPSHGTEENQAGEVDTGDIFLLIFASKKAQDSPSAALSTSLFLIPFPRDRVLAGLPAIIFKPRLSAPYVEQIVAKLRGLHIVAQPIRFVYPLSVSLFSVAAKIGPGLSVCSNDSKFSPHLPSL